MFSVKLLFLSASFCALTYGLLFDWEFSHLSTQSFDTEYYDNKNFSTIDEILAYAKTLVENWRKYYDIPGLVIGITIKGEHVWTESFGHTDLENNVTTHKDSVWRLASISKPITAALIGKLIETGRIDLDRPIYDYLPERLLPVKMWDNRAVNVTLRQTMSHMAGFHVTNVSTDFARVFRADNVSEMLDPFKNEKLLFKPGSEFSYSNYGYQVVGAVIESVLGHTYEHSIREMFEQLGMNSSFAERREVIIPHRPRYYQRSSDILLGEVLHNVEFLDDLFAYSGWWPSGGIVSTVDDLLRFGNVMLDSYHGKPNSYLNSTTVKELWTNETFGVPKAQNFSNNEYAKGWLLTKIEPSVDYPYRTLIWHSGGLLGTSTLLFIFPDQHIVMVAFANKGYVTLMDQILLLIAQQFQKFL